MVEEAYKLELERLEKEIYEKVKKHAEEAGLRLNPDKRILTVLLRGLAMNKLKRGEFYCPCRRVTGDPEKDRLIICPCVYHMDEIKKFGRCHCGLFVKG